MRLKLLKPVIHDHSTPRKWRSGTPHHSIFNSSNLGHSQLLRVNPSSTGTPIPNCTCFHSRLFPVLSKAREPRIYTGCISAFMARQSKWSAWMSRQFRNPNFRQHCSNCHWIFASATSFNGQQSNLSGVERS
ncbi:hypothetical protein AVEN_84284-1 [Araneus ventricosus]|uniref:Uncharacterized protein n=1 Tax=Araneus ventricosus TaxID=182803 RepID=A0A4Y2K4V2_ARAVE|nr:hypothetical protein AVEN_84284-1 [Araneus ventricosus]